jgi:hypothetical protein
MHQILALGCYIIVPSDTHESLYAFETLRVDKVEADDKHIGLGIVLWSQSVVSHWNISHVLDLESYCLVVDIHIERLEVAVKPYEDRQSDETESIPTDNARKPQVALDVSTGRVCRRKKDWESFMEAS